MLFLLYNVTKAFPRNGERLKAVLETWRLISKCHPGAAFISCAGNCIINPIPIFLQLGVVQVQQKVLGIIPSTTGASQTFTSFQPRTATVTIRPNTTGTLGTTSTSQVRCFSDYLVQNIEGWVYCNLLADKEKWKLTSAESPMLLAHLSNDVYGSFIPTLSSWKNE